MKLSARNTLFLTLLSVGTFTTNPLSAAAKVVFENAQRTTSRAEESPYYTIGVRIMEKDGVYTIDRILSGSPALDAGLRLGDQLIAVDGRTFKDMDELLSMLVSEQPSPVVLKIQRESKTLELTVARAPQGGHTHNAAMHQQGESPEPHVERPYISGLILVEKDGRILVDDMLLDSPAVRAGLELGDEILAVNGNPVGPSTGRQVVIGINSPWRVHRVITLSRGGAIIEKQLRLEHVLDLLDRLSIKLQGDSLGRGKPHRIQ